MYGAMRMRWTPHVSSIFVPKVKQSNFLIRTIDRLFDRKFKVMDTILTDVFVNIIR